MGEFLRVEDLRFLRFFSVRLGYFGGGWGIGIWDGYWS